MVKSTLLRTQNTVISAAFVLASATAVNAILGFLKGRVLASNFGVSDELAIFYTADRIPNLIYSVLVIGALSTVFIPVFTQEHKKNPKRAWDTAASMINSSMLFFLILGGLIFVFSTQIVRLLSLGKFAEEQIILGSNLMRIMLGAQFILILSSFLTCILQSFKYFIIPAIAPILYSLGMILGTIFLSKNYGIYGPAYGVIIGSLLHLLVQIPIIKGTDFAFSLSVNLRDKGMREIFSLIPPRLLSVFIANAISTINNSLAIFISAPSVVFLKFANQLEYFPVSLFGVSIAAAALPTLSDQAQEDNKENFKKTFVTSLHQMLFLVVPASVILLILKVPVVRIVYGVSNFPWEATVKTSYALAFFSLSIFAQSAVYLLTRAFYALKDTKTPVLVSSLTIFINIVLSLFFIKTLGFGVWSVAFSFSITSILDMIALFILLNKKVGGFNPAGLIVPFVKISYSAIFMGFSLYIPMKLLDQIVFDTTRTFNLLILTAIAGTAGMISYLIFTKLFKVEEIELFYKLMRRLKLVKSPYVTAAD